MRALFLPALAAVTLAGAFAAACSDDDDDAGGERRTVAITQRDDACDPKALTAKPGEKLRFEVKNEGKKDQEVEGIEGTSLEEVLVPSGKTRTVNYTAPSKEGTQKIKCYTPSG